MKENIPIRFVPETMTNEQREIFELASKASANIVKMGSVRLSQEEIAVLLSLIAEGCSTRTIIRRMKYKFGREVSLPTLKRYKEKYASKLVEYANDLEFIALNEGFARRAVRIERLTRIAEAMEEVILDEDGGFAGASRLIKEYRETLRQIAQEVGDMPTDGPDQTFINMTDEQLKEFVANGLKRNPDLSVILSERAGVRPQPQVELIDEDGEVISDDDGSGYKPRPNRA